MLIHIYSLLPDNLLERILAAGFKAFRFKQLVKWLYPRAINDLTKMTDLPQDFKAYLAETYDFALPEIIKVVTSQDSSVKFLLRLSDSSFIETVLMPEGEKNTLCLSSQIGCAFDCLFCATGKLTTQRDLFIHEIVAQVILAKQYLGSDKLTNLVFMGMGEPLDNLPNVIPAIRILQSDFGLQFSPRRMTISTCGYVPKIYELAEEGIKIKLAVSLNSAIDTKRSELMPVNNTYDLQELKTAIRYFRQSSPWRITFEYIMIPEYNMGEADARALMKYVGDLSCKVNLISWNKVLGLPWRSPTEQETWEFQDKLRQLPVSVTIRKSRGTDISAACGQLAAVSERFIKN